MIFKLPSKPSHCMILWSQSSGPFTVLHSNCSIHTPVSLASMPYAFWFSRRKCQWFHQIPPPQHKQLTCKCEQPTHFWSMDLSRQDSGTYPSGYGSGLKALPHRAQQAFPYPRPAQQSSVAEALRLLRQTSRVLRTNSHSNKESAGIH